MPCGPNDQFAKCAPALPCGFINARVDKCAPKIIDNKRYPNLFRPSYIPVKTPALPCGFIKACVDKCAPPKIINRYYLPKVVYGDSNNGK